jgi:hypothetical protein
MRGRALETFVQRSNNILTRNVPRFDEIAGGSHLQKTLDLNAEDWRSPADKKVNLEPGDAIVIIYDVPASVEARKMHVWYGFTAAHMNVQ